jgi:hypothetical protein
MTYSSKDIPFSKYFWIPILVVSLILIGTVALFVPSTHATMLQSCFSPPGDPCLGGSNFTTGDYGRTPDCSPIIIDVTGEGFHLTSAQAGVQFDITGTGNPVQIAWTASDAHNAFLVLDRNHDGRITNGSELFGNFTPQPASLHPNGFLALAQYDKPAMGGNGDGIIDQRDAIFSALRLWVDVNHDGIAQFDELFKLPDLGVYSISLNYKELQRTDRYGNVFRYRARINVTNQAEDPSKTGPAAYDVFLTTR